MGSTTFSRPVSQNERLYIELNRRESLFVIQMVLDLEGTIDLQELRRAVAAASEACPDARLVHSGDRWTDTGHSPEVHELEAPEFTGFNFDAPRLGSRVFLRKVDPGRGPNAEVFLLRKDSSGCSIAFRVFHGLMDGQGVLTWIRNIFRVMRGQTPVTAVSSETDLDFLERHGYGTLDQGLKWNCRPRWRIHPLKNRNIYWKRCSLPGTHVGTVAKTLLVLSRFFEAGSRRFLIPASLRRHEPELVSTGNLSLPLYLEVHPDQDWPAIYREMFRSLEERREMNIRSADYGLLCALPSHLLQMALRVLIVAQNRTGAFLNCGTVTNLGKIVLEEFSTASCSARTLYSLPTHQPLIPLSIALADNRFTTELVLSSYANVVPPEKADEILEAISQGFSKTPVS